MAAERCGVSFVIRIMEKGNFYADRMYYTQTVLAQTYWNPFPLSSLDASELLPSYRSWTLQSMNIRALAWEPGLAWERESIF